MKTNKKRWIKVYKVVTLNPNNGEMVSWVTTGDLQSIYKIGMETHANANLAKLGFGLFCFRTLADAKKYDSNCLFRIVLECKAIKLENSREWFFLGIFTTMEDVERNYRLEITHKRYPISGETSTKDHGIVFAETVIPTRIVYASPDIEKSDIEKLIGGK